MVSSNEDDFNPHYDPTDPRGVASPPDPEDFPGFDTFPLNGPGYPETNPDREQGENWCASCGMEAPPDRRQCDFCRTHSVPADPSVSTSTAATSESLWKFDHVIFAIVDAITRYEAVAKGAAALGLREHLRSFPKSVRDQTFVLVYDFDESPSKSLLTHWGELPDAVPLRSQIGIELLSAAWARTDWLDDNPYGKATYLYDEWGTALRHRGAMARLLTERASESGRAELWIVPALGYGPQSTANPMTESSYRSPERTLRECWSCGERTEHEFAGRENLPEGHVEHAIWTCRRCDCPSYGPDPHQTRRSEFE